MSFYYLREPGAEGQLLTEQGEAPGVPLSDLLDQGPLPHRVALELIGSVADILTIAEEDGATHGDLKPGVVKLDGAGAVAVEGFGQPRRGGRAPEGAPVGITTDTYGMGLLMHAMLTADAFGVVPRQRDEHDQVIVDRLLGVSWDAIKDRKWFDDVLRFICSMLSFEPSERPHPLDVANILYEVVTQLDPPDLTTWAAQRMVRVSGRRSAPTETVEEDLGGPTSLSGPMSGTGGFRVAASAKGESTAFWSKERIAALLADEDDEPPAGRRQSWSPAGAPQRPSVAPLPGPDIVSPVNLPEPPRNLEPPPPPLRSEPLRSEPLRSESPPPPLRSEPLRSEPLRSEPPPQRPDPVPRATPQPLNIRGPVATSSVESRQPVTAEPADSSGLLKVVVALGAVLFLACGGVVSVALFFYFQSESSLATEAELVSTEAEEPSLTEQDTAVIEPPPEEPPPEEPPEEPSPEEPPPEEPPPEELPPEPPPQTKPPIKPPGSSTSSPAEAAPRPSLPPEPPPEPDSGPMVVKVVSQGAEAVLRCGDGQVRTFVGTTRMTFDSVTTCRVDIGDSRGVFQASTATTITCTDSGGVVVCQ